MDGVGRPARPTDPPPAAGWTDAELYYGLSHFTKRPFSNLDGYYEVRDPRGGAIAQMLNYILTIDFAPSIIWGGSRWGISHLSVPSPISNTYSCKGPSVAKSGRRMEAANESAYYDDDGEPTGAPIGPESSPVFFGGYTPVGISQRCTGLLSKSAAQALCESTGGSLCASQEILTELNGRKLGCSLDGWPMWAASDVDNGQTKFVRCCAAYGLVNNCAKYTSANTATCVSYTTFDECVAKGSGSAKQITEGFGHYLGLFRENCAKGTGTCKGMVQTWTPRDNCVWCLEPDSQLGMCRPGGDYGICPTAPAQQQALFSLAVQSYCGPPAICELTYTYPDLGVLLGVPTASPTKSPTKHPVAPTPPTASPTPAPPVCADASENGNTKAKAEAVCTSAAYAPYCLWQNGACKPRPKLG